MAPWSGFWDRNVFVQTETLARILDSPVLRGAVSGVGLVTALAGLAELAGVFLRRRVDTGEPPATESR